ncbi:SusC/RagA family TonB-linked outer membrane protein [Hymenobacter taeanensis]|uniref:SusC/RagA family TonB-linked outer membrane protein n=1 Tax=Hymenobacter taeanensis TaxID=2735321 RepID=A0A6M6BCR9_9BACT|nr:MULTISPECIES: SusC/RagA family TonB-linked outer membrane protein [Hymenobacter]QJX45799.1 SusC/RagA family TonB-linked outer membrane protein [Hymenobacter taeanensis]UOQ79642.1 SusC/RagA family TonB-linked outer membrane protein [Hymenobacter sp. 5414T-23]
MRKTLLSALLIAPVLLQQAAAQNRQISGRVTDRSNGQGLPGVTVLVKGTTVGVSTNADGSYTISAPASATALTFSSIGYVAVERAIGDASTIDIGLASDSKQLGEVVVTGALGIQRQQQQVGYATATLDTKEVTQARVTNVTNGLTGKVSGLQVQTIGAGVSPQVRVTLRGSRSLTGNNEALVVIDGNISTNDALLALNPDDVDNISVLKGANAAALYGSQASNGALVITTKKGTTTSKVTLSQTSQWESVSFLPKFQEEFGLGANSWNQTREKFAPNNEVDINEDYQYNSFENQQFGPRFDGVVRPLGNVLSDGTTQMLPYVARPNEKRDFWNTGYQMQNSVTFSGGDAKTKYYASYQNVHNNGIVPKDKFDRNTFRFNASHEFNRLTIGTNISYTLQRVDATSNISRDETVYWNWFNTGVQVPLTSYKDWKNNPYASPDGYYNNFYHNPYYILDNNRTNDRRNTIIGSIDLSYKLTDWLRAQYRIGITNIDQSSLQFQNKLILSPYTVANTYKTYQPGGFVQDVGSNQNRINSDAFLSMDKTFGDISLQAILGNNVQQFSSNFRNVASTGLSSPGLYNLSNRVGNLTGSDASARVRTYAFYLDATVGYKDFVYVHGSGRYDNVSNLDASNRSFFYPAVDASFVFTNAIPALKDASFLDYGKIRGGITKVSQINLGGTTAGAFNSPVGVYQSFGAYALNPVFNLGAGYPFGATASYTAGNGLVVAGLKPETTISYETGIELAFLKRRVSTAVTYYKQNSKNQTISTSISRATGYSNNLINAGEVENRGIEVDLNLTPVRLDNGFTWTVGGNFNYNANKVVSLPDGLTQLALSTGGNAQLYAIPGQPFPILRGSHYQKTADGRTILAPTKNPIDPTGDPTQYYYPVKAGDLQTFGNTQPKYRYGFNTSFTYKGITLAGQGELRTGYVVYHAIGEDLDFTGSGARSAMYDRQNFVYPNSAIPSTDAAGNVTYTPNTSGLTPGGAEFWAQNSTWNRTVAENYVTSGKFFKIREVSLSYAIPASLVSKVGLVKGASVNLFGRNIFTWVPKENIYTDPEFNFSNSNAIGINSNLNTPPTKFYGATLNVTL